MRLTFIVFEIIFFLIAVLFLIGSLDDLIIDIAHAVNGLRPQKPTPEQWILWRSLPEKPLAIMIPAWQESSVLEAMVRTNLARIHYENYKWFIGVYPNDLETLTIAKKLEEKYPDKVIVVVTDRPGPTSKAHCLNCILKVIEGMVTLAKKQQSGWIPHYVAIHDAEDVIHPEAFLLINAQPADLDFIQLPIFSLPVPARDWISGTYLDEFAEIHMREIPVRKVLNMPIPSAGVGTFLSMSLMQKMGKQFHYWFDEGNLTEDYEVSLRIARLGGKQDFLLMLDEAGEVVATREYFPHELGRSIRQKTRWTTGIGLQTMAKWKWYGSFSQGLFSGKNLITAYAITRDRKALWANPTVLFAWFVIVCALLFSLTELGGPFFEIIHDQAVLTLVLINTALFSFRLFQRARFCTKIYGRTQGLLSIPRVVLSTYINGMACMKALYGYSIASRKKEQTKIVWDKTEHRFPDLFPKTKTEEQAVQ